jgi:multiple sugar transport system substrate-binding protein
VARSPFLPHPSSPRPFRRRARVVLPAAVTAVALLLAGCGDDGGDAESGNVTLRFSWWGSDSRHTATQKVIDLYESKNPGVKIEGDFVGWGDYWDRLATSVAGNNAPDIIQMESRYVREYADRGALADLTPFLGDRLRNADFDPAVAKIGEIDGKTYAVATGVNIYAVVANPTVLQAAKTTLPDDKTWSWDDLLRTAAQVTKNSPKGTYGLQDMGYVDAGLEIFARQRGESIYGADGKLAVSDATLKEWWNLIVRSRDTGAEPPASVSVEVQNGGVDQSLTATGKGALGTWWTNELPTLTESSKADLSLLRFPGESTATKPGMFLKPAMFYSVGGRSEHQEEAAKFVDFMLNDPEAAKIILSDRGLPVNLKTREAILPQLDPADQKSAAFVKEVGPALGTPPPLPPKGAGEVNTLIQQLNEQVLFNRVTVDQAVQQFRSQAESAIAG